MTTDRPATSEGAESTPLRLLTDIVGYACAENILDRLEKSGWICVPIIPSKKMLSEAMDNAAMEDPALIWRDMIEVVRVSTRE